MFKHLFNCEIFQLVKFLNICKICFYIRPNIIQITNREYIDSIETLPRFAPDTIHSTFLKLFSWKPALKFFGLVALEYWQLTHKFITWRQCIIKWLEIIYYQSIKTIWNTYKLRKGRKGTNTTGINFLKLTQTISCSKEVGVSNVNQRRMLIFSSIGYCNAFIKNSRESNVLLCCCQIIFN